MTLYRYIEPKAGQSSLVELDEFRYREAIQIFRSDSPNRRMTHDDVKRLVEWKLWVYLIVSIGIFLSDHSNMLQDAMESFAQP